MRKAEAKTAAVKKPAEITMSLTFFRCADHVARQLLIALAGRQMMHALAGLLTLRRTMG